MGRVALVVRVAQAGRDWPRHRNQGRCCCLEPGCSRWLAPSAVDADTVNGRVRQFAIVGALLLAAAACGQPPEQAARKFVASGDRYAAQGRYDAAAIEYRNAIKQQPRSAEPRRKLADIQMALGKTQQAYYSYSDATAVDPNDVQGYVGAGKVLLATGEPQAALYRAEQALEHDRQNLPARVLYARALAKLRRGDEGRKILETVIEEMPRFAPAHIALADLLIGQDDAAAESQLRTAVEGNPDDELANRALAAFYVRSGRGAEAEEYLKRAASAPQQQLRSVLALADYYAANHRYDAARTVLATAHGRSDLVSAAKTRAEALVGLPEEPIQER